MEGELEAVKGVEDGVGSEDGGAVVALDKALAFIRETGVDSFAPAIGTAHGVYKGTPKINFQRVAEIIAAEPVPLVVHGGTGLSDETFRELIRLGAPKVNISTQLKITMADGFREYLTEKPTEYDPLKLLGAVKKKVVNQVSSSCVCLAAREEREQSTHLRLRRRPRRHRAVRPPAGLQPDVEGDAACRGRGPWTSTAANSRSAAARNAWRACSPSRRSWRRGPSARRTRPRGATWWRPGTRGRAAIYKDIILSGRIPPRPGVKRIAEEAMADGWTLAVASTSAEESVRAVLRHAMGEATANFGLVLAGDCVKAKKPAPDIYLLAAERLGVAPADCVVVEDSNNGLQAAASAGMKCVVTVSSYTREEDFSKAAVVLTCLGDPGGEVCEVIENRSAARPECWLKVADLEKVLRG